MDKSDSKTEDEVELKSDEEELGSEEEELESDEEDGEDDDDGGDDDDENVDNSDDDDDDDDDDCGDDDGEADDGGDGDDDDDETEDCDDEDDDEVEDGDEAVLEASDSDGTDDIERCPICLNRFKDQDIGTPESCDHMFCLECIQEWSKNVNTCPSDRLVFKLILCKHGVDDVIYKKISVEDKNVMADEEGGDDPTYCEICNECNREDRLLLCDGCDLGYHLECLNPPLDTVPVDEWFCPACARRQGMAAEGDSGRQRWRRQIPRTLVMERVRSAIEEIRVRRTRNLTRLISSDEDDTDEVQPSTSTDAATPGTASSQKAAPKKRKTPAKRKIRRKYRRKTKRRTTKKRKTTKSKSTTTPKKVTPSKRKASKGRTKKRVKRRKRKGKKLKRLARTARPPPVSTVKSRIAGALGITSPPPGCTIPVQKKTDKNSDIRKSDLGGSFSIFGHKEELNFYEDEYSEAGTSGEHSGATRKYSRLSRSSYLPIGRVPTVAPVKTKKKIVINTTVKTEKTTTTTTTTDGATSSGGGGVLDLLGSIMQDQTKLAMSSKDVTIQRDGSLITKPASPEKPKKSDNGVDETSPSSLFKSSFQVVDTKLEKAPSILSSLTGDKETTDAAEGENEEEYDPAHPTDDVNDETKDVVEDVYDPAHPTDDVSSDDDNVDNADSGEVDNDENKDENKDENEVETNEPESVPEASVNEFELVKVKQEPGVENEETLKESVVENVTEKSKDVEVEDEIPTSITIEKSSIETVVKIEKVDEKTLPESEEFIERDQLIERIEKSKEEKTKSKASKESSEKFKLSGKFKPISTDNVESSGSTKLSMSDRFKTIEKSSKSPESANFDDEDPIHEMRKLDKELDLEFGNAEFGKKKDKNKDTRKNKRKISLDESEGDGLRYKRDMKDIHEKKKGEISDYKYGFEEKEEGEVDEEYRLKDKKKKDKKKRKSEKHFDNDEKEDSEIDRRIVIQVSQNTEDRTVWEEAERQRRKRDREEKRKDKFKDSDGKRDKKLKRLRSRSRSHERRRSRSKDRKRSRSRDRDRDKRSKKRRERTRSRSRSREWSHEKSRKKKKRDRKHSRDVDKDVGREWSRERSREREWSWENDWNSERSREHHRSRGDRKRSRDRSADKVDMFGRSRSPFTRKGFVKDKQSVPLKPKIKPFRSDEVIEILDSSPPKKQKYDEVSSSESEKMSPEREEEVVQKISTIEVKNSGPRETNVLDNDEKDDEFDDEPEETEQFQYTDREEFTGQNKSKQMRQNLITLGVGNSEYDPANPTGSASPAAPPLPESLHAPTPPLPPTGDFAQFPPPPPGPPPQGPPPGSVIIQDRNSLRVQPGGPAPGPGILGEAPLLLQGPPPMEAGPPPSLMQQGPPLSLPVNVLPPGFHRGLPPTIAPQRQVIVSPLRPPPPRVQGLPGARFGWQVTSSSEGLSSQFGTLIPSHARLPGHPIVNGPYDGLPPPSEPPLRPSGPGEPHLIHIGPDPRAPPPRLPIPLLPPSSDQIPISAMVSIPPPNSAMLSMPPPDISKCVSQSFNRPGTPPDSVSAILGLARMGANAVSGSNTLIPGLTAVSSLNVINGNHDKGSMNTNGEVRKMMGTSNKVDKMGENLHKSSNKQKSGSSHSKDIFKVPDVPAGKLGKTDVETTEVIDMDMGSPIIEEGNIELPVSPQFDNLIDNPEDLLEEDFNKKMQKLIEKEIKKESSTSTGKDKVKDKSATPTKNKDIKELKDSETKTDSPVKSKEERPKRSKENKPEKSGHRSRKHHRHHHKKHGEADKDLKQKALKDAHIDLDSQDLPSSAVDLTNKEKYLQKLHLQERVVEEVKMAIKPFYSSKKINKDQYKEILRKAVPKICHSKSGNINPMKIKSLVEAYVEKFTKRSKVSPKLEEESPNIKANGERGKAKTVR